MSSERQQPEITTHEIPGTALEITLRSWYLGPSHGWRWGVAYFAQGNGKADWRQRGTEHVFRSEAEARAKANDLYAAGLAGEGPTA